jgi:energy-coupling factor transport system permease protein
LLPVIKIILYILFVIFLFLIKNITAYYFIFTAILLLLFTIPFQSLKSGWIPISLFLAFTFVSNVLFQYGRIIYTAGPFVFTKEGFDTASMRTMRIFFMIAGAKILTATTGMESLLHALGKILKPLNYLGVPVNEFLSTMLLTTKSLPKLKEQIVNNYREKMHNGNIRGFWNRVKIISAFLLPLFVKSIRSPKNVFESNAQDERKD